MLQLRVFATAQTLTSLASWLDATRHGRHVVVFMTVAGVIAGYGVITVNSTLIVGAMAVSPDTLPLAATCVAAAYLGVALAVDQYAKAGGALAVLGVNVLMLLIAGTTTLVIQRWLNPHSVMVAGSVATEGRGSA